MIKLNLCERVRHPVLFLICLTISFAAFGGVTYVIEAKFEHLKNWHSAERNFSLRFSWWSEPKKSWQPLADWLDKTSSCFDGILTESTAKMTKTNFRY